MKKGLHIFKQAIILAVPISLVFSIYLNSLICILFLIVFIPDIIKNFSINNTKDNRNAFLVLIAFVGTYLIGFLIDTTHGIVNIKKAERLLPFVIFPFVFIYSGLEKYLLNPKGPLRVYGFFIVVFNLFLIAFFLVRASIDYSDTSFSNKRWIKRNVVLLKTNQKPSGIELETSLLKPANEPGQSELMYNRFFKVEKDTAVTRSVYVKSADSVWLLVRQYDGISNKGAWFNIKEGKIGFVEGELKANIEKYGEGWYRVSLTNKVSDTMKRERIQITFVSENKSYDYSLDKDYTVLIGGPQLEVNNKAGKYSPLKHRNFWEGFDRQDVLDPIKGHPTYYSLYIVFSSLIIFLLCPLKKIQALGLGVNLITIVLLGSKAAIITVVLLFLLLAYHLFRKGISTRAIGIFVLATLSGICLLYFSKTIHRFNQMFTSLGSEGTGFFLSTEKRLLMWETIKNLPVDKLLIGNGNIHGYQMIGNDLSVSLNAHNQYLEALLCSGFLGLILLLIYVFGPLAVCQVTQKNRLVLLFVLLLALNLFFENLLNRQWGIVFTSFFFSYLYIIDRNTSDSLLYT